MIHAYQLHGANIVLDIESGAVHVTDPVAFFAITHWPVSRAALQARFPGENLDGLPEAIEDLIARQTLFSPKIAMNRQKPLQDLKALCLHVSHTCNLTCAYCFAKAGRYHGKEALMPFEIGRQALDFLIARSGGHKNLEVDFFGGEPLMNWQVVKDLVGYARGKEQACGKRFRFTLTTNGVLVDDDVMDFCNREMHNVVLSLDGRQAVHDRLRRTVNDKGSYDIVVPKFQEFVRRRGGKNYYIRGTFTHQNPDFTRDLYHLQALGFASLSMEPVVCEPESAHALTPEDIEIVKAEYRALAGEMARRRGTPAAFDFYHYLLDLRHGPCLYKRVAGCGSGVSYLAVTPTGDFYPCHQFVGDARFLMGNVWQGVTRPDIVEDFAGCTLASKPACRDCWAKYYCAGGCAANACHAGGDIHSVDETGCELLKARMECAIWLEALGGK
ncbi:MAG: thioether cross-link-forming SCIFF peptide maturase [Oscillospiraceae bacterium]|jgi:uncharacterized protein|nr:thioether cross-link-forming SCIFF peptide maturase [Oscillospiraceae bacterium]